MRCRWTRIPSNSTRIDEPNYAPGVKFNPENGANEFMKKLKLWIAAAAVAVAAFAIAQQIIQFNGQIVVNGNQITITMGSSAPVAATPTFSPVGGAYGPAQSVSIADTTPGSSIFYTTDGTTPSPSSTPYTAPFAVASSLTAKAIATAAGYTQSLVGQATYIINGAAATPVAAPVAGTYTSSQTVTLTCATSGCVIHYTLDGSTPTSASPTYTVPFVISVTTTVKAIGVATGYSNSAVYSGTFTITPPFTPLGTNLAPVNYFTAEQPFMNILKVGGNSSIYQKPGWYTYQNYQFDTNEEPYIQIDANNYPTTMTPGGYYAGAGSAGASTLPLAYPWNVNSSASFKLHCSDGETPTGTFTSGSSTVAISPMLTGSVTGCYGYQYLYTLIYDGISGSLAPGATQYYQPGWYRLKFEGQGSVGIKGDATISGGGAPGTLCSGQANGYGITNSAANTYVTCWINVSTTSGGGLELWINSISGGGTDYPRDISLVNAANTASYDAGGIFNPTFLAQLSGFSTLRFMDWKNTNGEFNSLSSTTSIPNTSTTMTLSKCWTEPTGSYPVVFVDGEQRNVTFTLGSCTATLASTLSNTLTYSSGWHALTGNLVYPGPGYIITKTWATRSMPSNAFWSGADGVPLEIAVALCNQLSAHCYLNIPLMYTQANVESFTQLVMSGTGMQAGYSPLNGTLNAYLEISNEVWNGAFTQSFVAASLGALTWPGETPGNQNSAWNENYRGMWNAVAASYESAAVGSTLFARVYPTFNAQAGDDADLYQSLDCPYWTGNSCTNQSSYPIKQVSIAPYFGCNASPSVGTCISAADCTEAAAQSDGGVALMTAMMTQTSYALPGGGTYTFTSTGGVEALTHAEGFVTTYKTLLSGSPWNQYTLMSYEGGNGFEYYTNSLPCSSWPTIFSTWQRSSQMGGTITAYLNFWKTTLGSGQNNVNIYYNDISALDGFAWGLMESSQQTYSPLSSAPYKYQAAQNFIQ